MEDLPVECLRNSVSSLLFDDVPIVKKALLVHILQSLQSINMLLIFLVKAAQLLLLLVHLAALDEIKHLDYGTIVSLHLVCLDRHPHLLFPFLYLQKLVFVYLDLLYVFVDFVLHLLLRV